MAAPFGAAILTQMSNRFYVNSPLAPGRVAIAGSEARHMAAVCRLRPGDPVCLFNGDGSEYPGRVAAVTKRLVEVEVAMQNPISRERPTRLIVVSALPKAGRLEFMIEKLTELGVSRFVPLRTERSVVHPAEGRLEKLRRTVIESSKQCGRNVLMSIDPLSDWRAVLNHREWPNDRRIADPTGGNSEPVAGDVVIATGPEGGWTSEELSASHAAGWQCISLGARVLRVETAAIAAAVRCVG